MTIPGTELISCGRYKAFMLEGRSPRPFLSLSEHVQFVSFERTLAMLGVAAAQNV